MPYVRRGNSIFKKDGTFIGRSKNPRKYLRVLRAIEHGWSPKKGK